MEHADHVTLLRGGIPKPGGVWADFGSGRGAFTLALAQLIGSTGEIYSIDRDAGALRQLEHAFLEWFPTFPSSNLHLLAVDFSQQLDLPLLDGVVIANALHFQREKDRVVQLIHHYLRPGGRLIVVEYNVDHSNLWVPYPFSYANWEKIARRNGFVGTRLLATRPSRFLKEIYSAVSLKP